jgi:NADP-dependent 3-hydroxy acid dehydrogenase YdfG
MKAAPIDPTGAVVAITGAGRGIGRATAAEFISRGAKVALGDLDSELAAEAADPLGANAHAFHVDVTDKASFAEFIGAAESTLGPIDVLVNNAGVMPAGRFLDEDDATSALTMDVNVWGPIHGMRLVLPGMIERRRGHVVNIISMAGKAHVPGLGVYVASKHALLGLHRTVREEIEGTGVSASAILPTAVKTDLASGMPLGGLLAVEPEEVARAIAGTLDGRPGERAVPRIFRAYDIVPLLPGPLVGLVRKAMGQYRAITDVDEQARAAYDERLARDAAGHAEATRD